MTNKDERYIRIAKACLKALNQISTASGDTQKNIQSVYEAIDQAFRQEFTAIEQSRYIAETALNAIAKLDHQAGVDQARKIAQAALDGLDKPAASGRHH